MKEKKSGALLGRCTRNAVGGAAEGQVLEIGRRVENEVDAGHSGIFIDGLDGAGDLEAADQQLVLHPHVVPLEAHLRAILHNNEEKLCFRERWHSVMMMMIVFGVHSGVGARVP